MGRPNNTGVLWRKGGEDEKEKQRIYQREYKLKNKDKFRKIQKTYELKKKYGISYGDYEALLKEQKGCCALCGEISLLHVDHCHKTNKIRGLLCMGCNIGLGCFKDNIKTINRIAEYLK